jgi:hypothetical protein
MKTHFSPTGRKEDEVRSTKQYFIGAAHSIAQMAMRWLAVRQA